MGQFQLPMAATVLIYPGTQGWVAHALEFDLCAVEKDERRSLEKLQTVLKRHVEFGLKKGWGGAILSRAPDQFWLMLQDASPGPELAPVIIDTPKQTLPPTKSGSEQPIRSEHKPQYWVMLNARTSQRDAAGIR